MAQGRDGDALGDAAPALARAALELARRFASGGTLWAWAPGAREHAQHVAVEFVHPVIVGTRALPAVALVDDDPAAALRPLARAGDVLLVIADGDAPVAKVLQRAEAWGLTTIHLGVGPRPLNRAAAHVLWLSDDPRARVDGRLVLGYHVLWELTHVCFEHPGLVNDAAEDEVICTVCSDEGRLAEVVLIEHDDAQVRTAQGIETVSTLMVGPVQPGDLVLVHAGTAISVVDP